MVRVQVKTQKGKCKKEKYLGMLGKVSKINAQLPGMEHGN